MTQKVMIIGLDAAPPELIFEKWRDQLPNLNRLINEGGYGPLKSSDPPITCPAWMSMVTGKDAGTLGFYGFRNRKNYSYQDLSFVNSRWVHEDKIWDIIAGEGKRSILLGVPQTYPPSDVNGVMVSGFLTPGLDYNYTYPTAVKNEIKDIVSKYIFDVERGDLDRELLQIYEMTEKRFKLAEHFLNSRKWDFFMMVEMGTDRIQHFFWEYFDESHPCYRKDNKYRNAILNYYKFVDENLGKILEYAADDTLLLVVSDHGAQKMTGGFAINEWLQEKGYLVLREDVEGVTPIEMAKIDWNSTRAWGFGGYYGRIFLNVEGREPLGLVPQSEYESFRDELISELENISDNNVSSIVSNSNEEKLFMQNTVCRPEDLYQNIRNIPPDLMVYFNDLEWRSIGNLGYGNYIIPPEQLRPYSANHTSQGIFISNKGRGYLDGLDIRDVASTVISYYGIEVPEDMQGNIL
ncbi:MAG: alkaline phosphatase family protein [Halanaerobiaceae bacterium]